MKNKKLIKSIKKQVAKSLKNDLKNSVLKEIYGSEYKSEIKKMKKKIFKEMKKELFGDTDSRIKKKKGHFNYHGIDFDVTRMKELVSGSSSMASLEKEAKEKAKKYYGNKSVKLDEKKSIIESHSMSKAARNVEAMMTGDEKKETLKDPSSNSRNPLLRDTLKRAMRTPETIDISTFIEKNSINTPVDSTLTLQPIVEKKKTIRANTLVKNFIDDARIVSILNNNDIANYGQLKKHEDLTALKGVGTKTAEKIQEIIKR